MHIYICFIIEQDDQFTRVQVGISHAKLGGLCTSMDILRYGTNGCTIDRRWVSRNVCNRYEMGDKKCANSEAMVLLFAHA